MDRILAGADVDDLYDTMDDWLVDVAETAAIEQRLIRDAEAKKGKP